MKQEVYRCHQEKKSAPHSKEFKENAVRLALGGSKSIAATARNLGINVSTLHTWVLKYRDDIADIKPPEDVYAQLKLLQKENQRLKDERDILKKLRHTSLRTRSEVCRYC